MANSYAKLTIDGSPDIELNANLTPGNDMYLWMNWREALSALSTRRSETPKQAGHGVKGSLSFFNPRMIPFEGEIHATTLAQRVQMEQDLRKALALSVEQAYDGDDGYRLLTIADADGNTKIIHAKVLDMPEFALLKEGNLKMARFRFVMIAEDDIFLYDEDLTTTTGPESVLSTNFMIQDGALPTFKDGALPTIKDTIIAIMTVTNLGTEGTPPLIIIYGPTASPVVKNLTTGKEMSLTASGGLSLASGERVEIDVNALTITKVDGGGVETDASAYLTTSSEWIFIEPGANQLTLFDNTPSTLEAQLEVQLRSAWA